MWNNEYLESVNLFFVYLIVIAIFCIVSMLFVMYLLAIKVFLGKGIFFLTVMYFLFLELNKYLPYLLRLVL